MNNEEIKVEVNDIYKYIYFIAEMAQNSGDKGMYGSLAGKSDLMGGIFDRWINIIPESAIFNKLLLPKISNGKKVEVITDFYKYKPKQDTTGIAPDVLGLKTKNKVIPFVVYNNKWVPVKGMPQIEVKTFKKPQQMISLRDQGYIGKYLVMVESNYRVDYLVPFFNKDYFSENTYKKMIMNDSIFILNNDNKLINHLNKVNNKDNSLGTLKLLLITQTSEFINTSTYCESGVSPIRISSIEEVYSVRNPIRKQLSKYCSIEKSGLYRFNNSWYDGTNEKRIPYFRNKLRRFLDFYCNDIESIQLLKKNNSNMYIKSTSRNCIFNNINLKQNTIYKITFTELDRSGTDNGEYFLQKELISFVKSYEKTLLKTLKRIIENS